MLIYIAHPFQGLEENVKDVEKIILDLVKKNPSNIFVSPIHAFGFMFNDTEYEHGLNMCLTLLSKCDMMIVSGKKWRESDGVRQEIAFCNTNNIPILYLN